MNRRASTSQSLQVFDQRAPFLVGQHRREFVATIFLAVVIGVVNLAILDLLRRQDRQVQQVPRKTAIGPDQTQQILDRRAAGRVAVDEWQRAGRSEEHTSELQTLMRISYAVFCLQKKKHAISENQTCTQ